MQNALRSGVCFLAIFILSFSLLPASFGGPTPEEVVARADEVRNPQLDYTVSVLVTSYKAKKKPKEATYEVMIKGKDRTVIKFLTPVIDRGKILLMQGRNLWMFFPDASKPLRISFRERLIGEVANGDIARVNFTGDYAPEITRTETVDNKQYDVLKLVALTEEVTYSRVVLWVEKGNFHLFRAEFYGLSGRILKTCSYEGYQEFGGRIRPTRLVLTDAIVKDQKSVIEYSHINIKPLPEKYFAKNYMKKLMN